MILRGAGLDTGEDDVMPARCLSVSTRDSTSAWKSLHDAGQPSQHGGTQPSSICCTADSIESIELIEWHSPKVLRLTQLRTVAAAAAASDYQIAEGEGVKSCKVHLHIPRDVVSVTLKRGHCLPS